EKVSYALDISLVQEIIRPPQITPLPQTPDYFLGIANMRGCIVPVIDPARLLTGRFLELQEASRVIVLEVNAQKFGIMVGSVSEVIRITAENLQTEELLSGIATTNLLGIARINDKLILLPNPACFIGHR
ncbi:MAG: chemotaxis protein CheW, partial [Methanomassiliicoccales archaeon]